MSSLYFLGDETSYLRIPNTNEFNFGTGDFTIEWYQYQTDSNPYPRIFQIGSYSSENISIGVSIEDGEGGCQFYYWANNSANAVKTLETSEYKSQWVHFAICRSDGVTQVFMNGASIYSESDTNDFNSEEDLIIGNETPQTTDTAFGGYIKYFTWVKGVALYTSDFTVSTDYPALTSDYILLLTSSSFNGTLGSTVINNNVSTNFESNSSSTIKYTKPLYTNNSLVFYKAGSLACGGVCSVRNSRIKSRRV
jgi:hypothetical protein